MTFCELCTDDVNVHIVSKCNHNNICWKCIIKLRLKTGNHRCPFCNDLGEKIILTEREEVGYEDMDLEHIIPYTGGLYFENQKVKEEVDEFNKIKCPIHKCTDSTVYYNVNILKKHLKEKHNRYFCDICLDYRTLVFSEQKLFTSTQLDRHMQKGDLDDEGNVVFFHPYCKFCDKFFYDEEALMKHLRESHYKCDICDQDRKYYFYNKYENLEIHYNLSHYLCTDEICRKSHTVFKTAAELDHHSMKYHSDKNSANAKQIKNVNQNLVMSMTSFNYGQTLDYSKSQARSGFKDREGVDFEPQILSQRKFHTKFHTETEVSGDEKFDIRRYFPRNHIREFYIDESEAHAKELKDNENKPETEEHQDKREYSGYRGRRGRGRGDRGGRHGGHHGHHGHHGHQEYQEKLYIPKDLLNDSEMTLESCNMANYMNLGITKDELFRELAKVFDETERKKLQGKITDYYKARINEQAFFDAWVEVLGKHLTYKAFPFFIATCENEQTCKALDDYFYQQLLKLPRKHDAVIYEFVTYNDFFKRLYKEVETNIINRIKSGNIDFKDKHFTMDTHRILQLIQIIKRLSNADMASFKFAINFGLNPKTKETINDLLLHNKEQVQSKLNHISEQEIFILLKYLELCKVKLSKQIEHISLSKVSSNLLESIFVAHPDIHQLFEKELGKEDFKKLTEKRYVEIEVKPGQTTGWDSISSKRDFEERKIEVEKMKLKPGDKNFDSQNKFEFPGLAKSISGQDTIPLPPSKQKSKKLGTGEKTGPGSGWEKTVTPYGQKTANVNKNVELKKKVEEDFPTLAPKKSESAEETAAYWEKLNKPMKKTSSVFENQRKEEEAFYEENETLDDMVIGVAEKKGKKNKGPKKTFLAGSFK